MYRQLQLPARKEFTEKTLRRSALDADPLEQFIRWTEDAVRAECDEPYAMTFATASAVGIPSARTVLLKAVDERGFIFCTSYNAPKAKDVEENPHASLVFYWPKLERQVRISGTVSKTSREESVRYFEARPRGHKLTLWTFPQSQPVANRQELEGTLEGRAQEYDGQDIPYPDHWGGYVVSPSRIEFWQGGVNRLHDRFLYSRDAPASSWTLQRLAP